MSYASYNKFVPNLSIRVNKNVSDIFVIIACLLVAAFLPFLKPALYILLFIYCLSGPEAVIKAITLSWLLLIVTPAFGDSSYVNILKSLLPFVALSSLFLHWILNSKLYPPVPALWVFAFSMFIFILSVLSSYALDVSILKIFMFAIGLISLFWAMPYALKNGNIHTWFKSLFLSILFLSIPFLLMSQGYFRNGVGFQGILNHPQVMGTFAGIVTAWLFARVVMYHDIKPVYIFALVVAVVMLFLSGARVGVISAFVGIVCAFFSRSTGTKAKLSTLMFIYFSFCVVILMSIFFNIGNSAESFIRKNQNTGTPVESLVSSRLSLVTQSIEGFKEHPYIGIGFGLASNPADLRVEYDPIFGIPIGASVEKGVFFVAILEEIGIFGTLAFLLLLGLLFSRVYYAGNAELMVLFIAPVASNLGDATLFSLGGNGLFIWLMMVYAFCASEQIIKTRQRTALSNAVPD